MLLMSCLYNVCAEKNYISRDAEEREKIIYQHRRRKKSRRVEITQARPMISPNRRGQGRKGRVGLKVRWDSD